MTPLQITGRYTNQPLSRLQNARYEKITPARKQELNVVEVRHTSSTAEQGLSDPAAGISTLNDNPNISQTENKSTVTHYKV